MRAADVAGILDGLRFNYADEAQLHEALALAFHGRCHARREVRLRGCGRVDFLIERVGVEVKVGGSARAVLRQLERYARSDDIDELVLVTNRARHRLPDLIGGKPLTVIPIFGL